MPQTVGSRPGPVNPEAHHPSSIGDPYSPVRFFASNPNAVVTSSPKNAAIPCGSVIAEFPQICAKKSNGQLKKGRSVPAWAPSRLSIKRITTYDIGSIEPYSTEQWPQSRRRRERLTHRRRNDRGALQNDPIAQTSRSFLDIVWSFKVLKYFICLNSINITSKLINCLFIWLFFYLDKRESFL